MKEYDARHNVRRSLISAAVLIACWYLMEIIHECGHVLGAHGQVDGVSIPLVGISSTSYSSGNPAIPALASGPLFGALVPLVLLLLPRSTWWGRYAWFFCGFCLIANGVYLAAGVTMSAGDTADLIARGVPIAALVATGTILTIAGFTVWHYNGRWAGLA